MQKRWSPSTIVSLAKVLIQTQFLLGNQTSAISLGEAICYNLRQVYGALDPKALEISDLLSRAYIAAGHYNEAMRLHEEILRLIVDGDDYEDDTTDTVSPARAFEEVNMLKTCYLLLGGWDKNTEIYKKLVDSIVSMAVFKNTSMFKKFKTFDTWSLKDSQAPNTNFKATTEWRLVTDDVSNKGWVCGSGVMVRDPKRTVKRIQSNWGVELGRMHGNDDRSKSAHSSPGAKHGKPHIYYSVKNVELPS